MEMTLAEKLAALGRLGSATIHEAQGRRGAMDSGIKPIDPGMRLAGRAFTVDSEPADNLMLHYALTRMQAGDILVVDAKGFMESGIWGDVMTAGAQAVGCGGLIVDGCVRDAQSMVDSGFPVFARGLSIKGSGKRQVGKVQKPILCGGTIVRPGDIVVGDRDGLVVVDADEIDEVIRLSQAREQNETALRARLAAGERTYDIMGLDKFLPDAAKI
ncbi:4-carboxy-4-hydroxy-2-oxoadipate aldolase/oxaloacetate decarboxylase [Arsenicitalea aurantiaca]|uniref:Putative 4-hydroxy-4-methyl-2-oxoglutarate aldolase n=1 Tax=Arsenicitalea aurantiaca TaxID=1783274 RepID=A0A433XL41_9HYPH|nr:4-carboxy-4-hydroxy-2-oxoadipate aldolase/oxaloacetate decarboxylase [Arsenicitalea aurantiaca]RUT34800.1 4-carboxy-4-hydroxy-2-oxoadipate aldolase/oxaloacetate decarboxylase [Arsenicitalea aurantiaca]